MWAVFRPSARPTNAGSAAFATSGTGYLTSGRRTSIDAALGNTGAAVPVEYLWASNTLFGLDHAGGRPGRPGVGDPDAARHPRECLEGAVDVTDTNVDTELVVRSGSGVRSD